MKSHTFPLVYHFLISVDNGGFIHEKYIAILLAAAMATLAFLPAGRKIPIKKQKFRKILILKL